MNATTVQQLHKIVDIINPAEYDFVYRLLTKFITESDPLPDEIETIKHLDYAIANNDTVGFDEVDWN